MKHISANILAMEFLQITSYCFIFAQWGVQNMGMSKPTL